MLTLRRPTNVWLLFALFAIAAWLFSAYGWSFGWYVHGMLAFLALTFGLAVFVFVVSEGSTGTAAVLVVSLLIANWVLVKVFAAEAVWSFSGFAP